MRKISVGNDIISLKHTNAVRAGEYRFYSKFLTEEEQQLYKNLQGYMPLYRFAWLCWSIKESVYKFKQRLQPGFLQGGWKIKIAEINAPKYAHPFTCDGNIIESNVINTGIFYESVAVINSTGIFSYSFITPGFIYTITTGNRNCENIFWGVKEIDTCGHNVQHQQVRSFIAVKLKELLQAENIVIEKTAEGIPFLQNFPSIPLSLSHHENYVAYAFCLQGFFSIEMKS